MTISNIFNDVAEGVIERHMNDAAINSREITNEFMHEARIRIEMENAILEKAQRFKFPNDIPEQVIMKFMKELDGAVVICRTPRFVSRTACQVGLYMDEGEKEGLYVTDISLIQQRMVCYRGGLKTSQMDQIYQGLLRECPIKIENSDKDLIPVNNGIFDYRQKVLLPFSQEMVFTQKCWIDYNAQATTPPVIQNSDGSTWNVDDWVAELTDDPETTHLLFQVCGAAVRPKVAWEQIVFLYSTIGRNGKGTFCALLRELVGEGNYASISLKQMGQRFGLSQLLDVSAVITDENSVSPNDVMKDVELLKAVTSGDHIQLEQKYRSPIDFKYSGVIVQCINWFPRIMDTTDSMARRMLFVGFPKTFTGCDNKAIKADYLHRKDVLEYVLWKVLVQLPDYYAFDVPQASARLLNTYEIGNDPVREFWDEVRAELAWEVCPGAFLYALFCSWYDRNVSKHGVIGRNQFYEKLTQIVSKDDEWYTKSTSIPLTQELQFGPEPLTLEYNLTEWMNSNYTGDNPRLRSTPVMKTSISRPFIHKISNVVVGMDLDMK